MFSSDFILQFFSFKNGLELVTSILALIQGVFLLKSSNSNIFKFHALFLLLLGIHFLMLNITHIFGFEVPFLYYLFLYLYGPLMYTTICISMNKQKAARNFTGLAFLAILIAAIYIFIRTDNNIWFLLLDLIYIDFFLVVGLYKLTKDRSDVPKLMYAWLLSFTLIFFITNTLFIPAVILQYTGSQYFIWIKTLVSFSFILLLLNNFRTLFLNSKLLKYSDEFDNSDRQLAEKIKVAIVKIVNEKELYLNPNLDLNDLAKEISYPPRIVSAVMNREMNTNFYEYLNDLRASKAADLINQNRDCLIKEVMYDSGFGNKVTFNRSFKTKFGKTPTAYKNDAYQLQ